MKKPVEKLDVPPDTPRTRRRSVMKAIEDGDYTTWQKLCQRIKVDFRSKELWKIKILFLVHTAALYALFPFLTIHLKSLGISVAETSYIYTIIPFATIFSPPIMGYIADRLGNFRIFMAVLGFVCGWIPMCLLLIPNARDRVFLPESIPVNVTCGEVGGPISIFLPDNPMCATYESIESSELAVEFCFGNCFNDTHSWLSYSNVTTKPIGMIEKQAELVEDGQLFYFKLKENTDPYADFATCETDLSKILPGIDMELLSRRSCELVCEAALPRDHLCSVPYYMKENNVSYTFWTTLFVRVFWIMLFSGYMTLMDGAIMAIIKDRNGDLGLQHVWSRIGGMIFAPLSGVLMDYASRGKQETDYGPAMYLFAALKTVSALILLRIDLSFKKSSSTVLQDLKVILRQKELLIFYCICLLSGMDFGYIENYLFWWLEELGADKSLMGLSVTVGTVSGIPWLVLAAVLISKFGHINVIAFAMFAYAVRLVGYSFIADPYMCLPFEALECFTSSLMMTAFDLYAAKLSTMNTIASVMGIMGAVHYGFGRGVGSLVGGNMMTTIGARTTFRVFSIASLVIAIMYSCYYFFYIRVLERKQQKKEEEASKL